MSTPQQLLVAAALAAKRPTIKKVKLSNNAVTLTLQFIKVKFPAHMTEKKTSSAPIIMCRAVVPAVVHYREDDVVKRDSVSYGLGDYVDVKAFTGFPAEMHPYHFYVFEGCNMSYYANVAKMQEYAAYCGAVDAAEGRLAEAKAQLMAQNEQGESYDIALCTVAECERDFLKAVDERDYDGRVDVKTKKRFSRGRGESILVEMKGNCVASTQSLYSLTLHVPFEQRMVGGAQGVFFVDVDNTITAANPDGEPKAPWAIKRPAEHGRVVGTHELPKKFDDPNYFRYTPYESTEVLPGFHSSDEKGKSCLNSLRVLQYDDNHPLEVVHGTSALYVEAVSALQLTKDQWEELGPFVMPKYCAVYMGGCKTSSSATTSDGLPAHVFTGTYEADTASIVWRLGVKVSQAEALALLKGYEDGVARSECHPIPISNIQCGCVNLTNFSGPIGALLSNPQTVYKVVANWTYDDAIRAEIADMDPEARSVVFEGKNRMFPPGQSYLNNRKLIVCALNPKIETLVKFVR